MTSHLVDFCFFSVTHHKSSMGCITLDVIFLVLWKSTLARGTSIYLRKKKPIERNRNTTWGWERGSVLKIINDKLKIA